MGCGMSDSEREPSETERRCGVCGEIYHRMSTFVSTAEEFDFDAVCQGCVSQYLQTGTWNDHYLRTDN